jgi:hypothetical protein
MEFWPGRIESRAFACVNARIGIQRMRDDQHCAREGYIQGISPRQRRARVMGSEKKRKI